MRFVEIVITQRMLDGLRLPSPKLKTKVETWKEWSIEWGSGLDVNTRGQVYNVYVFVREGLTNEA